MRRAVSLLLLLSIAAAPLLAERRRSSSRGGMVPTSSGEVVSGAVTGISGSRIALAEGLIVLDVSSAEIVSASGGGTTLADLAPGTIVHALLSGPTPAADGSLSVKLLAIAPTADVTLSAPVESVDLSRSVFTILGRDVQVDAATRFDGGFASEISGLTQVLPGQLVVVQADAIEGRLHARSVLRLGSPTSMPQFVVGTAKSIGPSEWIITEGEGEDVTIAVDAQTRIIGSPTVGDRVAAMLTDRGAGPVAVAIAPLNAESVPSFPLPQQFQGVVRSTGSTWVLTLEDGAETAFEVTSRTVFIGNPQVGDRVDVFATVSQGKRTAHLIVRR